MRKRTRRRLAASLGLGLAIAGLVTAAYLLGLFSTAQLQSTDFLFRAGSERARATVIVGIDQRSFQELLPRYGPPVNWPRSLYAAALDALGRAKPRVVALDLFFDAPRPDDDELAAAMRRLGNVITPVEAQGPEQLAPRPGVAQRFATFVRPVPTVRAAAAGEGFVNVSTDADSVVRGLPLLLEAGDEQLPSLALATVAGYVRRPSVIDAPAQPGLVYAAGRAIPVVEPGRLLIDFLGPPSMMDGRGAFPTLSFVDLLEGRYDPALTSDRIVLIGWTMRGIDERATPTTESVRMWGVEVLGSAIETILNQRYLSPASAPLTVALIAGLALAASLLATFRRPLVATLGGLILLGGYLLTATIAIDNGLLLNLVFPPTALGLGFAAALTYRIAFEQSEQRLIRGVMGLYLSPAVSQWALRDPERLQLGGETREMTVLFSDIRGFTTLSHRLDPQALVALLNEYLTAMTALVFRHDGVLDKYIGDAIMAFWNAPLDQADHAERACATALEMIARLKELQADWERRGVPKLELGIGINSGPMVVGNMGSRQRLAYTVLGDAVNVAARLEGLSKEYGTRVVVGEATRRAVGDRFVFRSLDVVAVVGRAEPLAVYEVVGRPDQVSSGDFAFLAEYEAAVELYRARGWTEAARRLERLLGERPDDGPTRLYLRRSGELLDSPPPADWNGVYVARTK